MACLNPCVSVKHAGETNSVHSAALHKPQLGMQGIGHSSVPLRLSVTTDLHCHAAARYMHLA
jgi:hypothetical protein